MTVIDSFNTNSTKVDYSWPTNLSGIERIFCSAKGDLQRLLSSFFSSPIEIERVFMETSARSVPASPTSPVTQRRVVNLINDGHVVCVATSTVTLTSPLIEKLFLDEKYAIGQLFRRMNTLPNFQLLDVGTSERVDSVTGPLRRKLWRRYTLSMEGCHCDIVEEFPDRDLFTYEAPSRSPSPTESLPAAKPAPAYRSTPLPRAFTSGVVY